MKRLSFMVVSLACVAGLPSCQRAPITSQKIHWSSHAASRIDKVARTALRDGPLVGVSIAVAHNGEVIYARGFGLADIELHRPARGSTRYNMASVTKMLTAVAILKLAEQNDLDLDAHLADLLPEFPNRDQAERITVRHLLNHTSGLPDYVAAEMIRWEETQEPLTPAFVLDYLHNRPLDFPPGTNWRYSNTGFYLAGMIIERITGRDWADYIQQEVAGPLGLQSLALIDDPESGRAIGYDVTEHGVRAWFFDTEEGVRGDAGFCGSVQDIVLLPSALMAERVISEASLDLLLHPTTLHDGIQVDFGLGVALGSLEHHALWGHLGGDSESHVATLAHYPDDELTIAVLVNTRGGTIGALQIEADVARIVLGLGAPHLGEQPIPAENMNMYTGEYVGDRGNYLLRFEAEGRRMVRAPRDPNGDAVPLRYLGGNTFGRNDWPMDRLVFHVPTHRATALSLYYNGFFDGFYRRAVE